MVGVFLRPHSVGEAALKQGSGMRGLNPSSTTGCGTQEEVAELALKPSIPDPSSSAALCRTYFFLKKI